MEPSPPPPTITLGGGMFNIFRSNPYPQFQVEYRSGCRFYNTILPLAGFLITTRGATYLYGGFGVDVRVFPRLALMGTISAGLYAKGGGKDLYFPLEFRSSIECDYVFCNEARIGLQLSHISNASLSSRNPGVESLMLIYSFPLGDSLF